MELQDYLYRARKEKGACLVVNRSSQYEFKATPNGNNLKKKKKAKQILNKMD